MNVPAEESFYRVIELFIDIVGELERISYN